MWRKLFVWLSFMLSLCCSAYSQSPSDCAGAIVICSDGPVLFTPSGISTDDFLDADNDPGCLITDENRSVWYYFEFRNDMPPNSFIQFVINPDGGFGEDYDFAIYGPDVRCDSLGEPKRCSFANFTCTECPLTGLGNGATDTSEGAMGEDGFVAPMMVQPGQGFFMILDNWYGSSSGFQLTWGGSAAPYLNCQAQPQCSGFSVNTGQDISICETDSSVVLNATTSGFGNGTIYTWSSSNAADTLLDNPGILRPTFLYEQGLAGPFSLRLTAQRGACVESDSLLVFIQSVPPLAITGDTAACQGSSVMLSAPTNFVDYNWSTGDSTLTAQAMAGDTAWLQVIDSAGCRAVDTFIIATLALPVLSLQAPALLCTGSTTSIQASGGFANYQWSTGQTALSSITVDSAGVYSLQVTDNNGCSAADTVVITEATLPIPDITGSAEICPGDTTVFDAGAGFASYSWTGGMAGAQLQVASPGVYYVTVTDINGCQGVDSLTLTHFIPPSPSISGSLEYCAGSAATLSTQNTFIAFVWSNGSNMSNTMIGIPGPAGVTVTDANGCTGSISVLLTELPLPNPQLPDTLSFCEGTSVLLNPGTGFQSYTWSDNSMGSTFSATTTGSISVVVTDVNGCVNADTAWVQEIVLSSLSIAGPVGLCANETATLSAPAGFSQYVWSPGAQNTASIDVNSAGAYTVTVTDASGCTGSATVNIGQLPTPAVNISGDLNLCQGQSTTLSATPGFSFYEWSVSPANTASIIASQAGEYQVTVTDANGCTGVDRVDVVVNDNPVITLPDSSGYCAGNSILLNPGTNFITYNWSDGSSLSTLLVDQPGDYVLIVTDINGCRDTTTVSVQEYTLPVPVLAGNTSFCEGQQATLQVEGTWNAYQWSNGQMTPELTVSQAGNIGVTVTDANGCQGSTGANINVWNLPVVNIFGPTALCPGADTVLQASPGFVDYDWSVPNSNTDQLAISAPGTYALVVTDANGCQGSNAINISTLPEPVFVITGDTIVCSGQTTVLSVPNGFAMYQWSDNSQTATINVDQPGDIGVTVTNAQGCSASRLTTVGTVALPVAQAGSNQQIDCNNTSAIIGPSVPGTGAHLQYLWNGPGITPASINQTNPAVNIGGVYYLTVLDTLAGCASLLDSVFVDDLRYTPVVSLSVNQELNCYHNNATIDATGSTSGPSLSYNWYAPNGALIPGNASLLLNVNQAGQYRFEVVDNATGCSASGFAQVTQNFAQPAVDAGQAVALTCMDTIVSLTGNYVQNIGSAADILWTSPDGNILAGQNTLTPEVDDTGLYIMTVTLLANGCWDADTVLVNSNVILPVAVASVSGALDCSTTSVQLSALGSSAGANYTYSWFNASGVVVPGQATSPGTYTLQVVNQETGCKATDQVLVTENNNYPTAGELLVQPPLCFGQSQGSIAVLSVSGGTAPYVYSLNEQPFITNPNFSNLLSGVYELAIEDANGCMWDTTVIVNNGLDLDIDLGDDRFICLGEMVDIEAQLNVNITDLTALDWHIFDTIVCRGCESIELQPFITTTVVAQATSPEGCTARDVITIYLDARPKVYIPNVFSPNGDGINDIFLIFAGKDVAQIRTFMILDRWGNEVFKQQNFQPNDPAYGWDGRKDGLMYTPAVFAFWAEIEFIDGRVEMFKGDVTLAR